MIDWAPKTPAASALQAAPGHGPVTSPGERQSTGLSASGLSPQGGAQSASVGPAPTEPPAERPSPAGALEVTFRGVLQQQMQDMPLVNPALAVEAVGFQPWGEHWLGVLVTPWFMNLVLMPRVAAKWNPIRECESRHYVFPAGVFEFIGSHHPVLGDYQACSLFSPMFEFDGPAAARETALAAMTALFDSASREAGEVIAHAAPTAPTAPAPPGAAMAPKSPAAVTARTPPDAAAAPVPPEAAASQAGPRPVSKRDFIFGTAPRADRGP